MIPTDLQLPRSDIELKNSSDQSSYNTTQEENRRVRQAEKLIAKRAAKTAKKSKSTPW